MNRNLNDDIDDILRSEIYLEYFAFEEWGIEGWSEATVAIVKYIEENYIAKD